jgi:hypothetical protein
LAIAAASGATVFSQKNSEHRFLDRVVDEYANRPLIKRELSKTEQKRYPNVSELRLYRFTSLLADSLNANVVPKMILMVYVYRDEADAMEGLISLQKISEGWKKKEPDYSFVDRNQVFRLIGSCVIPDKNWADIKSELADSILGKNKQPEALLSISCNQPREIVPLKKLDDDEGPPTLKRRPPKTIDSDSTTSSFNVATLGP